jgi:hypothetical protein
VLLSSEDVRLLTLEGRLDLKTICGAPSKMRTWKYASHLMRLGIAQGKNESSEERVFQGIAFSRLIFRI